MDEKHRETVPADAWRAKLTETIEQHRRRIGERIAGQRQRLKDLEARIATQIGEVSQQLAHEHDSAKQKEQSLTAREAQTQQQRRHLAQQIRAKKKDLQAEAELSRAQSAASGAGQDMQHQLQLAEVQGKYEQLRAELKARETQCDEATKRLAELRTQLDGRQHEAKQHQTTLEQAHRKQAEVETERARLQAELQRQLEESRKQAESARQDLSRRTEEAQRQAAEVARLNGEVERVRRESHEQLERLRADHGKSNDAQVQSLHQQLDDARKQLDEARKQLDETRTKLAGEQTQWDRSRKDLESQLAAARQSAANPADAAELTKLRDENKQLEKWLAEAEEKAKQGSVGEGEGSQELEDLKRRFEMAVQDVRELKTKNQELTEQLGKARQSSGGGGSPAGEAQGGNWESLKQKLLADLESDFDEQEAAQKADKLTVQGAIKITDQVVAEKEQEIRELRRILDSQSQQVGDVAVGAAAFTQLLDNDELIRQERESLKRQQDAVREQLRTAEVDISVERAKLARERAELDEKLRGLEAEKANMPAAGGDAGGEKGKKAGGRKWLARLGLGDGKDG